MTIPRPMRMIQEGRWMRPMIQGVLSALVGMLVLVTAQMGMAALTDLKSLALMTAVTVALLIFRVNLIWVIASVACLSFLIYQLV